MLQFSNNFALISAIMLFCLLVCCESMPTADKVKTVPADNYLDFKTSGPFQAAGIQMIDLEEGYQVWTKRFGNNPDIKVLLLHGGPALTHEYMECFESYFPKAGIEFYHYDQLGSYYSDQPDDNDLWTLERFVDEVEQVRIGLGLDKSNFYILGSSWGGILGLEYALKYQENLKGLIISNMTADFDKYEAYNAKLRKTMRPGLIDSFEYYESREDFHNPVYADLVFEKFYTKHICRFPTIEWPEPILRSFKHINQYVYEYIQGPSEFVPGGLLKGWSVWDRLGEIKTPTLMVGAKYDSMNPKEMEEMSKLVKNGSYLYCANGSHLAMWDEQEYYMNGVIDFINKVNN
ncbi:MAG: proline iminopeptidase-family hydrolase [Chitinophagales bacterium]|nr:proline iminopeptidase-family hydrolase [Chitinophagales bacterium]